MDELTYDGATALVVVDVQNDFADPKGGLYVEAGEEVVPAVNREIERALAAGATVAYTQDWHPESTPHFEKDGGVWPVHCVQDTWGAELHPDLKVVGDVFRKGVNGEDGYSGFTMRDPASGAEQSTGLHEHLRGRGIEKVVVLGLAGDVCVKATAHDAVSLGYPTTIVLEGIRSVNLTPGDHDRALEEMASRGVHIV